MEKKEKREFVLYVLTKLELGGAQKVCLTLLKGLNEQGLLSGLISGADGVLVPQVQEHPNVHLLQEFKREIGFKNIFSEIKTFFLMCRLMKRLKREHPMMIVHTHSTKAGLMGRWAAFFAGVSTRVHTVHGFGFHDLQPLPIWTMIVALEYVTSLITTHYVCVSERDRVVGGRLFPWFTKKSSLIRAAVDWDCFYLPAKRGGYFAKAQDLIIGTVSCFKPQKNVIDLLKAFAFVYKRVSACEQKHLFLHIVGDGELRGSLELFVRENGLEKNVVFWGWQTNISLLMHEWDVFAMSSLWEGLPCAIVEARLSKLPVVCYDVGGIAEVVKDCSNGFLVKPGRWDLLAERLLTLVQNNVLRGELADYPDLLDPFKNSFMIHEHELLYRRLARKVRGKQLW